MLNGGAYWNKYTCLKGRATTLVHLWPLCITLIQPVPYREEVFGPVMTIVKFQTDAELVDLANDCPFGLGSNVFSSNRRRANAIASQLQACTSGLQLLASLPGAFTVMTSDINKDAVYALVNRKMPVTTCCMALCILCYV